MLCKIRLVKLLLEVAQFVLNISFQCIWYKESPSQATAIPPPTKNQSHVHNSERQGYPLLLNCVSPIFAWIYLPHHTLPKTSSTSFHISHHRLVTQITSFMISLYVTPLPSTRPLRPQHSKYFCCPMREGTDHFL